MRTGWIKNKDQWYYFNTDGTMAVNTSIDRYYLNDSGLIEETPSNSTNQNNSSKTDKTQGTLYKNDDLGIQKIVGKWKPSFVINKPFLKQYNCNYIDITTTTFQKHPYKVVGTH